MSISNFSRRFTVPTAVFIIFIFAVIFSGCSMDGDIVSKPSEMAELTSLALDYQSMKLEGEKAAIEVDDVNGDYSRSMSYSRSVFGVDPPDYILDDGTQVFITREYMDNGTPSDEEDDYIIITRRYHIEEDPEFFELEFTEVINIHIKPGADWSVWDNPGLLNDDGSFSQEGSVTRYIGDIGDSSIEGEMIITWEKNGAEVELLSIKKESVSVLNMTTVVTTITFDVDDNPIKEQIRIRVVDGDEIVVHSFIYTQYEEGGFVKTKILREDGAFCIRWRDPDYVAPSGIAKPAWIQDFYNENGILRSRKVETGYRINRNLLLYVYDETGTVVIDTRSMDVSFRGNDDGSIEVKKILDNGKVVTLNIIESDQGYTIDKDGFTYFVTVDLKNGIVEIFDESGTLLGTVIIEDDGSYTVQTAGGDLERIEI